MRRLIFTLSLLFVLLDFHTFPIVSCKSPQAAVPTAPTSIYFDDSGPELLVLGNDTWEVAFRKTNGGIVYITDKTVGGMLSTGSRYECL